MILTCGEAWALYSAWRYGGTDPWRLYNLLDADFRPLWDPKLAPVRPLTPTRLRAFMYACGRVAAKMDGSTMKATSGNTRKG